MPPSSEAAEGGLCHDRDYHANVYDDAQLHTALIASRRLIIGKYIKPASTKCEAGYLYAFTPRRNVFCRIGR